MSSCPQYLSHYYESARGPFVNLSDMSLDRAEQILEEIRQRSQVFASRRASDYLRVRRELEERVRSLFIAKRGKPVRARPQYMILGSCPWVQDWYVDGRELCIPLNRFDPDVVSFTYGDTFPAMRFQDGRPYRGQVYRIEELGDLIHRYGLPQECNPNGERGPDRYIEAQIWDNAPLRSFLQRQRE